MRPVTIFNSENIYTGYDPAIRRAILDVLDANKILCKDNWKSRSNGGIWEHDRVGQSPSQDVLYRIDVRKADAEEAVRLLKQAGIF